MFKLLLIVLKGFGQVMLQENPITGFLFLAGIAASSVPAALLALLGNIVGAGFAYLMHYSPVLIDKGIYGFNGVLIGIAASIFFKSPLLMIVGTMMGAMAGVLVQQLLIKVNLSPLTFPFVVITWIIILLSLKLSWLNF